MLLRSRIASFTLGMLLVLAGADGNAQLAGKVSRIGYLDQGSAARNTVYLNRLRQGLRELGWIEGENIMIEPRFAEGRCRWHLGLEPI